MHHIAILNKAWKLDKKILSGEKTIESRWYKARYAPWNRVHAGDVIYFKNSGEPATIKTDVEQVLQFSELTLERIIGILNQYGKEICIGNTPKDAEKKQDRKYCILIFLKNPQKISSFQINKTGYGNACAWMCVDDVKKVKTYK